MTYRGKAAKALGRALPKGSHVHHLNGDDTDHRNSNLVICPSAGYHKFLHKRMRAREEGCPLDWCQCSMCKMWMDPCLMVPSKTSYDGTSSRCRACSRLFWKRDRRPR